MEITEYKQKNGLYTQEKLLKHIDELKRNTVVNQELVNFLVDDFFAGEKSGTNATRHKSRSGETHTVDCNPLGYRDVSKAGILELEKPLEFPQLKSSSWSDLAQDKYRIVFRNPEEVKTNLNQDNYSGLFYYLDPYQNTNPLKDFSTIKDDVITNSNRGEKEVLEGFKEKNGKMDYSEINLGILDLMATRFTANKHKYPQGNMKKPIDIKDLEWALFRHIKKMIQPVNGDEESYKDHLAAILCNGSMILDQLNLQESK